MNVDRDRARVIGIVGAGRAGATIAAALATDGWTVTLFCRQQARRRRLIDWFASRDLAVVFAARLQAAVAAPVVIFATADRDLTAAADAAQRSAAANGVWLHLSGVVNPSALAVKGGPVLVGSCHPLCAILDPLSLPQPASVATVTRPLRGAFFATAGAEEAQVVAAEVARSCGGQPHRVATDQRDAYHAAATVVANDLVALLDIGERLSVRAGLAPRTARKALLHLARTAVDAVESASCGDASTLADGLTGAVGRGDAATLQRHLLALSSDPNGRDVHAKLSAVLLNLVGGRLDAKTRAAVARAIRDASPQ